MPLGSFAQAAAYADDPSGQASTAQTYVVDNSTGETQDGTPMGWPGVKVGDTYYTVGASAIAASAGGSSNLVLYGGKDWLHKQPVLNADGNEIVIAGPDTHFKDPNTGDEIYPFANAKSERVAFSQTPSGKFIVWVHWEMNSDYNASETIGLISDNVTGPYKVYQNHQRPGASTVDANGGHDVKSLDDDILPATDLNTDNPEAFGDRVGRLIGDQYSIGADGNRLEKPAQASYPEAIQLYNTNNGGNPEVNGGSVNPVKWETTAGWNLSGDTSFGTSATGGNGWTYQFNDLHDTLRLKARAVRMTNWDTSAWSAAQARLDPNGNNGNVSANTYVQRYPAVKTSNPADEGKYAAGVDGSAYVGKTTDGVDAVVYPQDAPAGGGSSELTFTPCAGDENLSFAVSYQEGSTGHFVCDGDDSNASRWSTWNQSNASATFKLAQGYVKGGKTTVTFSESAPDGILVEGRTATGEWKQIGTTNVGKTVGTYDVAFDPTIAFDQARVTMQGQWMKANEITFSGYTALGQVSLGGITYGADASKVSGFDPGTLTYKVSVPDLAAIGQVKAVNPQGTATVVQPTAANGYVATIAVKNADESVVKTYTVTFAQSDSSAAGAYDPNTKDSIFPEVGEIDASKTMSSDISFDESKPSDGTGANKPAVPLLSPRLNENNVDDVLVLRGNADPQKSDAIFATNTSPATYDSTIWLTNDGSDPTDPNNPNRIAYNTRWNPYPIVVTEGNGGQTLVSGDFTIKAATQTGSDETGDLKYSDVVSQTFRYAMPGTDEYNNVPIFQPVSTHATGSYHNLAGYQEIKVFGPTYGTEVFYTMDNSTPTPARYGQNIGYGSRDYTIINDSVESGGDGKAYFITAADDQYMRVWQLNDSMTAVVSDKEYDLDVGKHREAPQLIRGPHGTHLYLFTSGQSGWYKNQAQYQRTKAGSIADGFDETANPRDKYGYRDGSGAWTSLQPFADATTYNSQVGGVFNLGTKDDPNYLFSGSHWVVGDLEDSYSIWLPMTIDDDADGPGSQVPNEMVNVAGKGDQGQAVASSFPAYQSDKGLVTVKYSGKVFITVDANGKGTATADPDEENIDFDVPNTYADLQTPEFKADPDNHTPRVIDYQKEQQFDPNKCDIPDTNGWQTCATGGKDDAATWTDAAGYLLGTDGKPLKDADGNLIRDPSQVQDQSQIKRGPLKDAGIIRNYSIKTAFDGKDWDLDNYDGNEELYQGTGNDFFITLDLGEKRDLKTIGLSFKSVGGSDNAHRYGIYATNEVDANGNPTNWRIIVNNKQNNVPGFQAHNLAGDQYRYVKYVNVDNVDMSHGKTGQAWSRGLYEMTVSAAKPAVDTSALATAINKAQVIVDNHAQEYTFASLVGLNTALVDAKRLLDAGTVTATQQTQAVDAINTAISGLVPVSTSTPINTANLATLYLQYAGLNSDDYTADSWAAMATALGQAKGVLSNANATSSDVQKATDGLTSAYASLKAKQKSTADKSALDARYAQLASTRNVGYSSSSWANFQKALVDVRTVLDDPSATQAQVDAALSSLDKAHSALAKQVKHFKAAKKPVVIGAAKVGHKLTAQHVSYSIPGVKVTYQWLRNGKTIRHATRKSYELTRADRHHKISVRVSATKAGYQGVVTTTKATSKVK